PDPQVSNKIDRKHGHRLTMSSDREAVASPPARERMKAGLRTLSLMIAAFWATAAVAQAPVRVEAVSTRTIVERVSVTGTVTSPRTAVLSTAVAGLVADITVDEGRRVAAGDAILRLDAELAELALERSFAEVRQRETALADARRRLDEAERVGPERGIARTQIESLRAEVASEEASLEASRIAAREQAAIVERHRLRAPFAGVISERYTELGEWVNPGDALLELVAIDNLRFDFRVSQNFFGEIKENAPVEITLDTLPGQKLSGRVSAIVPVKDPGARTFLVRVLADASESIASLAISPGMSASAAFSLDAGRSGIAVSRDAILRFPDGRVTAWVVDSRDGLSVVREQAVSTGLEFDGYVEIRAGLSEGDRAVTHGNESLQEGQTIKILDGGP
ncbi:MAG TPA: efflux RND transporter periplasmic adaptor subunit, partial [Woeseiaceae bacterium]